MLPVIQGRSPPRYHMSLHNADNSSDGDWDEREDLGWNEFDWARYLREADQEIIRFLDAYQRLRDEPEALDAIAHDLGWDRDDWTDGEADEEATPAAQGEEFYTVHRHPVYQFTRGLYRRLQEGWEAFAPHAGVLSPAWTWNYAGALHAGENEALQGIQALDLGDYALAICHFKSSLATLHRAFAMLEQLPHPQKAATAAFLQETRRQLFDLREVWLRVLRDCRDEFDRRLRGDSTS